MHPSDLPDHLKKAIEGVQMEIATDHSSCGAEIIQLERALSKLVKAAEACLYGNSLTKITNLRDAAEDAKGLLS